MRDVHNTSIQDILASDEDEEIEAKIADLLQPVGYGGGANSVASTQLLVLHQQRKATRALVGSSHALERLTRCLIFWTVVLAVLTVMLLIRA